MELITQIYRLLTHNFLDKIFKNFEAALYLVFKSSDVIK